jgi:hypothetical protein
MAARKQPLRGATEPRLHSPYLKGKSKVDDVIELATLIKMPLLPWQTPDFGLIAGLPLAAPVTTVGVGPDAHEGEPVVADCRQGRGHPPALPPTGPVTDCCLGPPEAARPARFRVLGGIGNWHARHSIYEDR